MEKNLEQSPCHCLRVVLFGPESTGKTTLAKALAIHYQTKWVPEYAREYLEEKWHNSKEICAREDMFPIALGQMELENQAIKNTNKFLFCDTTLLSTQVYSEAYFEEWCDQRIVKANQKNTYDIYFLTDIDVPWKADLLRDRPHRRKEMFERFQSALTQRNITYTLLKGSHQSRMNQAITTLNAHL